MVTTTTATTTTSSASGSNTNVTFSSTDLANAIRNADTITSTRIPTFWTSNPEAWFIQAEAMLEIGRVTTDNKMYSYLLTALPTDALDKVMDIIREPPAQDKYVTLKSALLDRYSLSEEKRLSKLLYKEEMGDRTPSEFFRHLQNLAGSSSTAKALVKKIWRDRLPSPVDVAVIPLSEMSQDIQLSTADKIWERTNSKISAIANPFATGNSSSENQVLRQEVSELKAMIEKMQLKLDRRGRSRDRGRSNSRRRSWSRRRNDSPSSSVCWYHRTFGSRSTRCRSPCSYTGKDERSKN